MKKLVVANLLLVSSIYANSADILQNQSQEKKETIDAIYNSKAKQEVKYNLSLDKENNLRLDNNGDIVMYLDKDYINIDYNHIFDYVRFDTTIDKTKEIVCSAISNSAEDDPLCNNPFYVTDSSLSGLSSFGSSLLKGKVQSKRKFSKYQFAKIIKENKDFIKQLAKKLAVNSTLQQTNSQLKSTLTKKIADTKKELEDKINKVDNKTVAISKDITKIEAYNSKQDKKISKNKKAIETTNKTLDKNKKSISKVEKKLAALQDIDNSTKTTLKDTKKGLVIAAKKIKINSTDITNLKNQMKKNTNSINSAIKTVTKTKKEINSKVTQIDDKFSKMKTSIFALKKQNVQNQEDIFKLNQYIQKQDKLIAQLVNELKDLKEKLNTKQENK